MPGYADNLLVNIKKQEMNTKILTTLSQNIFLCLIGIMTIFLFESCARKIAFQASSIVPGAEGTVKVKKDQLQFTPCFPSEWPSVKIQYKYGTSTYHITVYQLKANEESWWKNEAGKGKGNAIQLVDDGIEHRFEVHVRS